MDCLDFLSHFEGVFFWTGLSFACLAADLDPVDLLRDVSALDFLSGFLADFFAGCCFYAFFVAG